MFARSIFFMKTNDELIDNSEGEEQNTEGGGQSENIIENLKYKKKLELQLTVLNKIINTSNQLKMAMPETDEKKAKAIINLKKFR